MQGFLPAISVLSKQYLFQQRSCFIGKFLLGCSHVAWLCQWVFGPVLQLVFDPAWFVLGLIWLLRKGVHGSRISARGQLCCRVELLGLIPFPGGEFVSRADNAGGSGREHSEQKGISTPLSSSKLTECTTFSRRGQCVGEMRDGGVGAP